MSSFVIKLIAIISMFCDHTGDAIVGDFSVLSIIGRIAFPLFAFQLVIGYEHTHDLKKYMLRLLVFAFISQIPYGIMIHNISSAYFPLNIFFTLLLGIICMYIFDYTKEDSNLKNKRGFNIYISLLKLLLITFILIIAQLTKVDYEAWGVFLILFIHIFYKQNKAIFSLGFIALCIVRYISYFFMPVDLSRVILFIIFTAFPLIFMLLYNGKKGPSIKYFFYAFYPVHLIILDIIHFLI